MRKIIFGLLILISITTIAQKQAKVVRIIDGDTFVAYLLKAKKNVIIRVNHIDTPENKNAVVSKQQIFATEATNAAKGVLTVGKVVKLYYAKSQSFGREIARVKVDGYYFDRYMLRNGFAHTLKDAKPRGIHRRLENAAKKQQLGLWNIHLYAPYSSDSLKHPADWRVKYNTHKK